MIMYDVKEVPSNDYMSGWGVGELFPVYGEAVWYRSTELRIEEIKANF